MPPQRVAPQKPDWHQTILTKLDATRRDFALGTETADLVGSLSDKVAEMTEQKAKLPGGGEALATSLETLAAQVRALNV